MMLRVNLLPDRERRAALSKVEHFHRTPLMGLVFAAVILTPIGMTVQMQLAQRKAAAAQQRIAQLEPQKKELEQAQQSLQQLKIQEEGLTEIIKHVHDLWSARLNALSNHTLDGVWFRELSFDTQKGLMIQGSALSQDRVGMASATQFAQTLKADKEFAAAFKEIRMESIKSVQDGQIEVVQFTLSGVLPTEVSKTQ